MAHRSLGSGPLFHQQGWFKRLAIWCRVERSPTICLHGVVLRHRSLRVFVGGGGQTRS